MPITDAKQVGTSILVYENQREIARYAGELISFNAAQVQVLRDNKVYCFGANGHLTGPPVMASGKKL